MTSLLVAGASGASGIAWAPPAIMPKTKAVAISLFIKRLPICLAGYCHQLPANAMPARTSPIAWSIRPNAFSRWPPLLGVAAASSPRADRVADAHAGGDRGPEQRLAGEGCRHLLVSSEVFQHWRFRLRNAAAPAAAAA